VARVRLVWLRVLPPSGVSAKEKDLCSPCYLDKVREFDDGAGEVVLLAWLTAGGQDHSPLEPPSGGGYPQT